VKNISFVALSSTTIQGCDHPMTGPQHRTAVVGSLCSFEPAHSAKKELEHWRTAMNYTLEAMILSAVNMPAMVEFYSNVFGIDFSPDEIDGLSMYSGSFSGLEFTLVPAVLTGVTDPKNPTHYDVYTSSIEEGIELVEKHGGRTNGHLGEDDFTRAIGIFDPDGNFMVLKQRK
jgi:predicted enzyme related to lactoylglutathione lyase